MRKKLRIISLEERIVLDASAVIAFVPIANHTIYVDSQAHGTSSGTSWANAFTTVQAALGSLNALHTGTYEVLVAGAHKGVADSYTTSGTIPGITNENVVMQGGYNVTGNTTATFNPNLYPTVLSGAGTGSSILTAMGSIHLTLDSLTLANANTANNGGGLIMGGGAQVLLNNDIFRNDTASQGGAVYDIGGNGLTVTNSTFSNNTATLGTAPYLFGTGGGALWVSDTSLTVAHTSFTDNSTTGQASNGGAMSLNGVTTINITNSSFTGNTTTGLGGAIQEVGSSLGPVQMNLSQDTFTNNSALQAGAISIDSANFNGNFLTFIGNTATGSGGGAISTKNDSAFFDGYAPTVTLIQNSVFIDNTANGMVEPLTGGAVAGGAGGGALAVIEDGIAVVKNSTFIGNTTNQNGGAIEVSGTNVTISGLGTIWGGADLTVTNSSFVGNSALQNSQSVTSAYFSNLIGNGGAISIDGSGVNDGWLNAHGYANLAASVTNSNFIGNHASMNGGAIAGNGPSGTAANYNLTLTGSSFLLNNASANGGALYLDAGAATIGGTSNSLHNTFALDNAAGHGDEIYATASLVNGSPTSAHNQASLTSKNWFVLLDADDIYLS